MVSKNNEIIIMRTFNSSVENLWKAWTNEAYIKEWWGPEGFSAPVIKIDLRKGGKYLYSMKDNNGKMYWSGGEFIDINPLKSLTVKDYFSDENGNKVDPLDYNMDPDFPKESIVNIKFDKEGNKTKLSIIYPPPDSNATRDAIKKSRMEEGWNSSLNKLQKVVEKNVKT